MDPRSKEFKELQRVWDAKLAATGFKDAEQRKDGNLKLWSSAAARIGYERSSAREEYYRQAGHFLHDYPFPNHVERRVWELHTEGVSRRKIVVILREEKTWFAKKTPTSVNRRPCSYSVQHILEKLTAIMLKRSNHD